MTTTERPHWREILHDAATTQRTAALTWAECAEILGAMESARQRVEETAAHALTIDQERMAAESRARDLEAENARLRALLAEDVALLEELDAAWGGAGGVCS